MQQGLRPYVLQDENALGGLHRPLAGGAGGLKTAAGEAGFGKAAPASGFPGARKALGNITNQKTFGSENGPAPGKTPAGGAAPARRALGDITNSNLALAGARTQQKPAAAQMQPQQAGAGPATAVAAAAPSRADVLAEDGVERWAGRSWEQLEADRLAREEEESRRRLAALASYVPARPLPNFFPLWGAPGAALQQAVKKDVLPSPPPSPMGKLPSSAGAAAELSVPDLADFTLPDIPCDDGGLGPDTLF